ncbi:MAG: NAD(P)-dependent oxidoreductase [Muribaculaceae bacterium]|nr:NAD(P)-dependent oxidoreductase [Muribaculaceae bacterium]
MMTVCITGATGVMGFETVKEFVRRGGYKLRLLVRPSKRNRNKMKPFENHPELVVVWGDLINPEAVKEAVKGSDMVLHIGGMVSPQADWYPEKTMKVNVGAARNVVEAVKSMPNADQIGVVYIGSVAETSNRSEPFHWGRTGDPIMASKYDYYGISKIKAERIFAESGLRKWVVLRQSGILHKGLIYNGSDPISFHVPLNGVLEWATVEDSARLMYGICSENVSESFWRNFYNIGSGKEFRLTNYEFEKLLLKALGCPPPEKVFDPGWFAIRNFHGHWYVDSDLLETLIPFRENITAEEYFTRMKKDMPWWMSLTPLAPAFLIKWGMKQVAKTKDYGTLDWLRRDDCEEKIEAYFGSREAQSKIRSWEDADIHRPSEEVILLSHGYDESKSEKELDIEDMREAARFRGGECLSETMRKGDLDTPLKWRCAFNHQFEATPRLVLKGGHWCPECLPAPWRYDEEARVNPFLAQVWKQE